jgi:preprotein translocase subunit SecA
VKEKKLAKDNKFQKELFAVVMRGIQLVEGYLPRYTQIITVLLMLYSEKRGLLMQVSTGEGKSLIIGMLTIIKCLQGHTIDIVTSSPVLAKRDAHEMK